MEKRIKKIEQAYQSALNGQTKQTLRNLKKLRENKKKVKSFTKDDFFFIDLIETLCHVKDLNLATARKKLAEVDKEYKTVSLDCFEDLKRLFYMISSFLDETPLLDLVERSSQELGKDFKFYKFCLYYNYLASNYDKTSSLLTKFHKMKENSNMLFGSFYLKLYKTGVELNKTGEVYLDNELFLIRNHKSFDEKSLKGLVMVVNLSVMTGNKYKAKLSVNNRFLLLKLETLKICLTGKWDQLVEVLDKGEMNYEYFKFLLELYRTENVMETSAKEGMRELVYNKAKQLIQIEKETDFDKIDINHEGMETYIDLLVTDCDKERLMGLFDILKKNVLSLENKKYKDHIRSQILLFLKINHDQTINDDKFETVVRKFIQYFHYTHNIYDDLLVFEKQKEKIVELIGNEIDTMEIDDTTKQFKKEHLSCVTNTLTDIFETALNNIQLYFDTIEVGTAIAKGQRRKQDDYFIFGLNNLLKFYSETSVSGEELSPKDKEMAELIKSNKTQFCLFLLNIIFAAKQHSPYNFDITQQLCFVFNELSMPLKNIELFYAEDFKGNQHEVLGSNHFKQTLTLNLFNDKYTECIDKFFRMYSENYRETGFNIYRIAKHGNLNILREMEVYRQHFTKSQLKGTVFLNLKTRKLLELLQKKGEKTVNVEIEYFREKLGEGDSYSFLAMDLESHRLGLNSYLNPAFSRFLNELDNLIFDLYCDKPQKGLKERITGLKELVNQFTDISLKDQYTVLRRNMYKTRKELLLSEMNKGLKEIFLSEDLQSLSTLYQVSLDIISRVTDKAKIDLSALKQAVDKLKYDSKSVTANRLLCISKTLDLLFKLHTLINKTQPALSNEIKLIQNTLLDQYQSETSIDLSLHPTLTSFLDKLKKDKETLFTMTQDSVTTLYKEEREDIWKCLRSQYELK